MRLLSLFVGSLVLVNVQGFFTNYRSLENLFNTAGWPFYVPDPIGPRSFPVDENYTFTEWSDYSSCSKVCGGGKMERTRQCLNDNGTTVAITKCSSVNIASQSPSQFLHRFLRGSQLTTETQQKTCNSQSCRVSVWDDWSACDTPCGGGVQQASRTCLDSFDQTKCNFQSLRQRHCNEFNCYRVGEWGSWGACSKKCEGGKMKRQRGCVPNVDPSSQHYQSLLRVKQQLESFALHSAFGHARISPYSIQFHYIRQYTKACDVDRQDSASCNSQKCPSCPANQQYFSCKPCTKLCSRPSEISPRTAFSALDPDHLFSYVTGTGCNGFCEEGCGCPIFKPYLGRDYRCYTFQWQCPSPGISSHESVSTTESNSLPPIAPRNLHTSGVSTTTHVPKTTSTTDAMTTQTTQDPIDEEQELPKSSTTAALETTQQAVDENQEPDEGSADTTPSTTSSSARMKCEYGIMIATRPGEDLPCACEGEIKPVPCYSNGGTSCPVVCQRHTVDLVCPPTRRSNPLTKNASGKCEDICYDDTDCAVGDLCCATTCGKMCFNGVARQIP